MCKAVQSLQELLFNSCSPTLLSNTINAPFNALSQVGSAILVSAPAPTFPTFLPQVTKQTLQTPRIGPIAVCWQLRTGICHGFHPGRSFLSSGFIEQPHRDPEQLSHQLGMSWSQRLSFASECHPWSLRRGAFIFWGEAGLSEEFLRSSFLKPNPREVYNGQPQSHQMQIGLPWTRTQIKFVCFTSLASLAQLPCRPRLIWPGLNHWYQAISTISCLFFGPGGG